jgi:hypothetical protein
MPRYSGTSKVSRVNILKPDLETKVIEQKIFQDFEKAVNETRLDKIFFFLFFIRKFYLRALVPIGSPRGVITSLLAGELRLLR